MRRRKLWLASVLVAVPCALLACGDDDNSVATKGVDGGNSPTPEAGGGTDSGAPDTAKADTSTPASTVRCTQAEFDAPAGANGGNFTAFPGVDISFPTGGAPAQYGNHCAKVKVGSDITFAGSFVAHPLEPMGGDSPSPIPTVSADPDGGTVTFKVTTAGTFGYQCNFHPSSMFGAIQVVP